MNEDIERILASLTETLRLCRGFGNINSIVPVEIATDEGTQTVARMLFNDSHTIDINITGDSGLAAVFDICLSFLK